MIRIVALVAAILLVGCQKAEDPVEVEVVVTKGGEEMILIPAGEFTMGCDDGEDDEKPPHTVKVDAFLMDRYEVRQKMFARLELSNPSHFKGDDHPADNLTWLLAAQLCNLRSEAEGLEPCYDEQTAECDYSKNGYRLPTEAEWEYACRAGTSSDYGFGSDPRKLREYAWFADNASKRTHPVGKKKPNAWGLYDMHGNVAEWCQDPYDPGYYASSPTANPRGPEEGEMYVVRGGAWNGRAATLRSSARGSDRPGFGDACLAPDTLGVRCVRKAPSTR